MGFLLSGFTVSQNVKLQNAVTGANRAIKAAYGQVKVIQQTGTITPAYQRFFGGLDKARIDQVTRVMNMMAYATDSSFLRYNRSIGRPGTYAAAQRPASGWSEKNVKQILDQGEFTMKVDDAFYAQSTSKDEAILTIAHELSHLVGNTDDVDCPWDNETAYGLARVRRLAAQYPALAIQNADSYGYYVVEVGLPKAKENNEVDLSNSTLFA